MHSDKKNSSWLAAQYIFAFTIGLVGYYLNLHLFKEKLFGTWLALASLWGMGNTLDFGFGLTIVKFVAQYNNEQKSKINEFISSIFFVFMFLGFLVFIVIVMVAYLLYFDNPDLVPAAYNSEFKNVFVILGVAFIFQYFTLFMKSILEGLNSFVVISKINLLYTVVLFAGVAAVSVYRLTLIHLSIVYLISALIAFLLFVLVIRRKFSFLHIRLSLFNYSVIKGILKYSFSVQATSFFGTLIDPAIKYVIGNNYRIDYVPIYELARRATSAISGLFFTAFKIILPKVSILKNKEEYKHFLMNEGASFTRMGLVYSGCAFGILSLPILFSLRLFFKYDDIIILFLILGLGETINNVGYTIYMFILGIGRAYFVVLVQFINVVIVTVSLILGFSFFHNAFGLLGYFITVVIVNIMTFLFVRNQSGINLKEFLYKIRFDQLFYLLIMMILALVAIANNFINYFYILFIVSIFSLSIFRKGLINYSQKFFIKTIKNE